MELIVTAVQRPSWSPGDPLPSIEVDVVTTEPADLENFERWKGLVGQRFVLTPVIPGPWF